MSDTNNPWASPEETPAPENQENTGPTSEHQETQIPMNPQNSNEATAPANPQPAETQAPSLSGRIISVTPAGQASAEPAEDSDHANQPGVSAVAQASSEVASVGSTSSVGDGFTSPSESVPAGQPVGGSTGSPYTTPAQPTDTASDHSSDTDSAQPVNPTSPANVAN